MRVYHVTAAQYAVINISLRRFKIARFCDLNDAFELLAAKLSDKKFRRAIKSWMEDFLKANGLLCFSKTWGNLVLWSHYADKQRGIAPGVKVADYLVEEINNTKD